VAQNKKKVWLLSAGLLIAVVILIISPKAREMTFFRWGFLESAAVSDPGEK